MALLQRCEHNVYPGLQCSSAINENGDTHLTASKQQATASAAGQRMETPRCSAHPVSPHQPSRAPAVPTAPTSPGLRALALVWHHVNNRMLTDDVGSVWAARSVKVGPSAPCNQVKSDGAPGGCDRGRRQRGVIPITTAVVSAPDRTQTGWMETRTKERCSAVRPARTSEDKMQGQAAPGECLAKWRKSVEMDSDHHLITS